ncbi:MAG: Si-specific NAD(P)(+) transhydrogenase [Chloroflexi bacterium]|nr:Si-specific NAD(P)(+) transhydrogenase [Chloroflexota bacterium]
MKQFDIAVIGAGPAGQRAAVQAAKLGASVVAIEPRPTIGGAAVNGGTIPSKALREAVMYLTGFRERGLYGVSYSVKNDITLQDLTYRLDHVLKREIAVMESQLARNGVEVMLGRAAFSGDHTLVVDRGHEKIDVRAENVILTPGSRPAQSEHVPVDGDRIFDTDQILSLRDIPRRMTIIGAGVVGVEYACMFAALGVRVTLVEMREQVMPFVDREIIDALIYHMRETGVVFQLGETVGSVTTEGDEVIAVTGSHKRICSDVLLYTIGRQGSTDQLGLEKVGLEADERGCLKVDERYCTSVPYIYAAGDVIGFPALASSSMEQGRIAARNALGAPTDGVQDPLPFGIYTIPEISIVGKTEAQLTLDCVPYEVGMARYSETARGQIVGDSTGRLKLLVHTETRDLLGVHIIGEGASELIHIGQAVIALRGRLDYLVNNVFNYPTLAECYKVAALDAYNKLSGAGALRKAA